MALTNDQLKSVILQALKGMPIIAVYLFGSQATGRVGPLSDYDVAVLFDESGIKKGQLFDARLETIAKLTNALKTDRVDTVVLNEAPSTLAMNIISYGKLLLSTNEPARIAFESRTIAEFLDRDYYERRYNKLMRKHILQGKI